jgi:hypothetical protein
MPKPQLQSNPRIEITPTPAQYAQLCDDLKKLRGSGAVSNTAAILEAVRDAAERGKMPDGKSRKRRAAQQRPRHGNRR